MLGKYLNGNSLPAQCGNPYFCTLCIRYLENEFAITSIKIYMKKIIAVLSVALVLLLVCIYFFIPNRIIINEKKAVAANREALYRNLSNINNWPNWWPGEKMQDSFKDGLTLNGLQYKMVDQKVLSLPLALSKKDFALPAELTLILKNTDSTDLILNGIIQTSYNPLKRVQLFLSSKKIKKDVQKIFESIAGYYSTTTNLYQYNIQKQSVADSILLSTFKEIKGPPSTEIIYELIDVLRNYIKSHSANETGYPMLNVFTKDGISYMVKVAIPVNKKLADSGNISYKWMLGGGNILITEVKGGLGEINKAYEQIQLYISDHRRVAPAIPFQSLVTDRRKEPDSSKWITKIYYPVM
jgi:hypothetical protein